MPLVTWSPTTNDVFDTTPITLQKMQQVGVGGSSNDGHGAGAPAAAPTTTTKVAFYINDTTDSLYEWNVTNQNWVLIIGPG